MSPETKARLDAELTRRFWALYDAAKPINDKLNSVTVEEWAAFYTAFRSIPESQRPKGTENGDRHIHMNKYD